MRRAIPMALSFALAGGVAASDGLADTAPAPSPADTPPAAAAPATPAPGSTAAATPAPAVAPPAAANTPAAPPPLKSDRMLSVGRIIAVDLAAKTAVVSFFSDVNLPSDLDQETMLTRDSDLVPVSRLQPTPYHRGEMLGVFILEGKPAVGDDVVVPAPPPPPDTAPGPAPADGASIRARTGTKR